MDEDKVNKGYRMVEIPGRHGTINLGIPEREATQEEIDDLHRAIAEVIVNRSRRKKKAAKKIAVL